MNMIKLYDVVDTRTNQFHSIAIIKERNAKWFVPATEVESEPVIANYEEADEADD